MPINNSEEETFRKLKQSPFIVVFNALANATFDESAYAILEAHNWTFEEYEHVYYTYYDKVSYVRR